MAKLTEAALKQLQAQEKTAVAGATDRAKKNLITQIFNWQQSENIYAWDEESLQEDLGVSIQGFTLAGETSKGVPVEVEFRQPLDEDVTYEGVAFGFRLIQIQIQGKLYSLQRETTDVDGAV